MDRREPLVVTALVAGLVSVASAQQVKERDARLTLTVVSFSGVPAEQGDAMADELASQLVETGRYRVMARDWLAASPGVPALSVPAMRDAAGAAGIEYLVLGHGQTTQSGMFLIDVRVVSVGTGEVIRTAAGRSQMPGRTRRPMPVVPMTRPSGSVLGRLAAAAVSVRRAPRPNRVASMPSVEQALASIARSITLSGESR